MFTEKYKRSQNNQFGNQRKEIKRKSACKPGSVVDSHSSGQRVATRLKQPTRGQCGPHHCPPIWSCSGWGLPCHRCCQRRGALLPHHFTLTSRGWRYIFCGTFRRLTPPRRYLAPCPVEPGLSSAPKFSKDESLKKKAPRLSGRLPAATLPKRRCTGKREMSTLSR